MMNHTDNTAEHFVFVYGSLKRGHGNHRLLYNSEFFGTFSTERSCYNMFSFGYFPGVYELPSGSNNGWFIEGEVYKVDNRTLNRLDCLESNGSFYTRYLTDISGLKDPCWMYLLPCDGKPRDGSDSGYIVEVEENKLSWNKKMFDNVYL